MPQKPQIPSHSAIVIFY